MGDLRHTHFVAGTAVVRFGLVDDMEQSTARNILWTQEIQHAADAGDPEAQFNLGLAYDEAQGVPITKTDVGIAWRPMRETLGPQDGLGREYGRGSEERPDTRKRFVGFAKLLMQGTLTPSSTLRLSTVRAKACHKIMLKLLVGFA